MTSHIQLESWGSSSPYNRAGVGPRLGLAGRNGGHRGGATAGGARARRSRSRSRSDGRTRSDGLARAGRGARPPEADRAGHDEHDADQQEEAAADQQPDGQWPEQIGPRSRL
ncbi:hypothetical protein [Cryobacterium sp. Sr8]|uniref:hypothetical protein n=1 Tax=Cryobacterium sp. Sr8 TaxID=1259203 RepID=UPI00141B7D75|nr:hypothetical protein [Cryobacterium sp. Sr8]